MGWGGGWEVKKEVGKGEGGVDGVEEGVKIFMNNDLMMSTFY